MPIEDARNAAPSLPARPPRAQGHLHHARDAHGDDRERGRPLVHIVEQRCRPPWRGSSLRNAGRRQQHRVRRRPAGPPCRRVGGPRGRRRSARSVRDHWLAQVPVGPGEKRGTRARRCRRCVATNVPIRRRPARCQGRRMKPRRRRRAASPGLRDPRAIANRGCQRGS